MVEDTLFNEFGNPVPRINITKRPGAPPSERELPPSIMDVGDEDILPSDAPVEQNKYEPEAPLPREVIERQMEMQGVFPDPDPELIQQQRNAPKETQVAPSFMEATEAQPEIADAAKWRTAPSFMDATLTREEQEDAFDNQEPFQVAGPLTQFGKKAIKAVTPPPSHVPPPPMGHNQPPPGMGLPPPPAGAVPPPPAGPGRQIVHGVGDEKPFDVHDLYTQVKDDLHPLSRLQKMADDISPLAEEEKFYQLARLTRGSYGRAHQAIANSTFDFNTLANKGPGLKHVLNPVKDDLRGFEEFAVAMRDVELHGRGINPGVPLADAQAKIAAAPQHFRSALNDLHQYQDDILQYVRDSGLLSDDAYTAMKAANQHYVPFNRLQPGGADLHTSNSNLKTFSPIKGIKGSDKDILSPIETIIRNTHYMMDLAEKNHALNALIDATQARGMSSVVKPVKRSTHPIHVSQQELEDFFTKNGLPVPGTLYGAPDNFTIFRPNALRPARDEIVAYRGGKPYLYKVDPEIADAVNGMGHQQVNLAVRLAAIPAQTLRLGVTLDPGFSLLKNPVRDQIAATVYSKNGYLPVIDYIKGLGMVVGNTKKYQDWLKSGGANSALVSLDRRYIEEEIRDMMQSGAWNAVKRNVRHPLQFLGKLAEYSENATRAAEFSKAVDPGFITRHVFGQQPKSIHQGGFESREVTLDFQRQGSHVKAVNRIVPFWNPSLEGTDRLRRAFQEDPAGMALKVSLGITLPTILAYEYNRTDPRMMDIPRRERDIFWHFPTDDWQPLSAAEAKMVPDRWKRQQDGQWEVNLGTIYKVAKPFTEGVLFGSSVERAMDAYYGRDKQAWSGYLKSVQTSVTPPIMPQFELPMMEAAANYSYFRERPLVSERIQSPADRSFEYYHYTSETAKVIGSAMANIIPENQLASPIIIESYINGWSGTLGRYALAMTDAMIHGTQKATGTEDKGVKYGAWKGEQADKLEKAEWGAADYPVMRTIVSRMPSAGAQPIIDFFDNYDAARKMRAVAKRMIVEGQKDKAETILRDNVTANLQKTARAIGNQFRQIEMIQRANNIPAKDKKRLIDMLTLSIIQTAGWGNDRFREAEAKLKGAR